MFCVISLYLGSIPKKAEQSWYSAVQSVEGMALSQARLSVSLIKKTDDRLPPHTPGAGRGLEGPSLSPHSAVVARRLIAAHDWNPSDPKQQALRPPSFASDFLRLPTRFKRFKEFVSSMLPFRLHW